MTSGLGTLDLLRSLVAFPTVSAASNLALVDFVEHHLPITPHTAATVDPGNVVPQIVVNLDRVAAGEDPHNVIGRAVGC